MQTSQRVSDAVARFAVALCGAARMFTLPQLARFPQLAWRAQPIKCASSIIRQHAELFEKYPAPYGEPWRFRLTNAAKRKFGFTYKNVDPVSSKAEHWLAFGDLWVNLATYGGYGITPEQPAVWVTHPRGSAEFDLFLVYRNTAYLVEVQRSKLTSSQWAKKWAERMKWYNTGGYAGAPWQPGKRIVRPELLLVGNTSQQLETVGLPAGVIYVTDVNDVARRLVARKSASNG